MKLAVIFEVPDDQADTYADVAARMIQHHAFAEQQTIKHWSFDLAMRPVAAAAVSDAELLPALRFLLEPDEVYAEARREAWARAHVASAGKSWKTHTVKFDGTVLPRER
jgi:hypothetical protein